MNNLETLKQELLLQKQEIENKGGTVIVANTNPSPSEITQGIKNLPILETALATATEADVLEGKSFYAGNSTLKFGTYKDKADYYKHLFEYTQGEVTSSTPLEYTFAAGTKNIRQYMFCKNHNYITFNFNPELESVDTYAFEGMVNATFTNLGELENLKEIRGYAFSGVNPNGIDLANLPPNLETLLARAFADSVRENCDIVIPNSITTFNSYAFYCTEKVYANNLTLLAGGTYKSLPGFTFHNIVFNCDLVIPSNITETATKFAYNGSFNNITIPATFKTLGDRSFSADSTVALSDVRLQTVTFESATPPTIKNQPFATQAVTNGLKIYVPDEAVDEYKASFATTYQNCIVPVSQKV